MATRDFIVQSIPLLYFHLRYTAYCTLYVWPTILDRRNHRYLITQHVLAAVHSRTDLPL